MHIAVIGPCTPKALAFYMDADVSDLPDTTGTAVDGLVAGLLHEGHRVTLITTSPQVSSTRSFAGRELDLVVVSARGRARRRALDLFRRERRNLGSALRTTDAEVIHAHWTYEYAWAALSDGRPVVITAHDSPFTVLRRIPTAYRAVRLVMAWCVRARVRHLTTVSPYLARKWRRQMLYRRPVAIVPNIAPFRPTATASKLVDGLRILDIADSAPLKNVETLLQAFTMVKASEPEAELILVGSGLEADGPLALSHQGVLGVSFVGRVGRHELPHILQKATVFAHASLEESQGICFLEAFAYGLPSLGGQASGGVPWTLDYGRAGLLVDVSSPNSIADAILRLHRDPILRDTLTSRARALLECRHSRTVVTAAYVQEYEKALTTTHPPMRRRHRG